MIGIYIMQYNYRSLYLVTIGNENEIKVYNYETCMFIEPFHTSEPNKLFIGKGPIFRTTEMLGARDKPDSDGHTIFLM